MPDCFVTNDLDNLGRRGTQSNKTEVSGKDQESLGEHRLGRLLSKWRCNSITQRFPVGIGKILLTSREITRKIIIFFNPFVLSSNESLKKLNQMYIFCELVSRLASHLLTVWGQKYSTRKPAAACGQAALVSFTCLPQDTATLGEGGLPLLSDWKAWSPFQRAFAFLPLSTEREKLRRREWFLRSA